MSRPRAQYVRQHVNDSHVESCSERRSECGITAFNGSNYVNFTTVFTRRNENICIIRHEATISQLDDARFVPEEQKLDYNETSFDRCTRGHGRTDSIIAVTCILLRLWIQNTYRCTWIHMTR
jgi:hypothetical protein